MNEKDPVFFLVKNRALGDSIMGLSTVSYLRSLYPKSTIIYAIPQWTAKLYEKIETDADYIYPLKLDSIQNILDLYTDLINFKVSAIHEMHQTGTGSKVFSVFSKLKAIPYTFHNHHLLKSTIVDQGVKKELIQRDLDGVYSYYQPNKIKPNFLDFEPSVKLRSPTLKRQRIIFGVVATRSTKMWSIDAYLKLAQLIFAKMPQYEIVIPLSNSKDDLILKQMIESKNTDTRIKTVQIPLSDLPHFFSESMYYIGNDTGLKHLAIATKLKSITMFGPEPIREWHPYHQKNHRALFIDNLQCRVRLAHFCGLSQCDLKNDENMQCMNRLTPELVFAEFLNLCQ